MGNNVLAMVIRQGLKLTMIGIAIGLLASWGLTRFLAGNLFGITPTDPLTTVAVVVVMITVAVLAIWVPARRALDSRVFLVSSMTILRAFLLTLCLSSHPALGQNEGRIMRHRLL
jgi:hypothetical protein